MPPQPSYGLRRRDSAMALVLRKLEARDSGSPSIAIIAIAVVSAVIVVTISAAIIIRRKRARAPSKGKYQRTAAGDEGNGHSSRLGGSTTNRSQDQSTASGTATNVAVDRTQSVRSIMTLPAYQPKARDNERVLGREGERDGVDVIVEHNTEADEEQMREEEMESLYQIRLARRQELADREARRQERAAARAAGDHRALTEIRARQAREREQNNLQELRTAHGQIKQRRERAVSSVSYQDLGVARADGTRLRANSSESDRVGLLSDAASIGGGSTAPHHSRDRSASSVVSFDSTTDASSFGTPHSGTVTPRLSVSRTGGSPDGGEADLGDSYMLASAPPGYDDIHLSDMNSRSPTPTPNYQGPPPGYPGGEQQDLSQQSSDESPDEQYHTTASSQRSSRGVGGIPQLPSLRIGRLPEIVIEPSTAAPSTAQH